MHAVRGLDEWIAFFKGVPTTDGCETAPSQPAAAFQSLAPAYDRITSIKAVYVNNIDDSKGGSALVLVRLPFKFSRDHS